MGKSPKYADSDGLRTATNRPQVQHFTLGEQSGVTMALHVDTSWFHKASGVSLSSPQPTTIPTPTFLSWGFLLADHAHCRVLPRNRAETCGLPVRQPSPGTAPTSLSEPTLVSDTGFFGSHSRQMGVDLGIQHIAQTGHEHEEHEPAMDAIVQQGHRSGILKPVPEQG